MKTPTDIRAARLSGESPTGSIFVEVYALSDVGRTREHNEDAYAVSDLSKGTQLAFDAAVQERVGNRGVLFMVADGMGGAAAGELASATAVDVVLRHLREHWTSAPAPASPDDFVESLERATTTANGVIYRYATEHVELRGMGTTATIAGLLGDTLFLAQVGDSRAYLVREGAVHQITKDQSLIQKLVEAGEMTEAEAALSERRNIILQALGPEAHVKVDLTHQQIRRGDVLLLCSDGLSGLVTAEQIGQAVRESGDLLAACRRLVEAANDAGGPDNITVVAARFDGGGLERPAPGDVVGHQLYRPQAASTPTDPDLETLLRDRTEAMMRGESLESMGPAVRDSRRTQSLYIRAVLLILAIVLGVFLLSRWV